MEIKKESYGTVDGHEVIQFSFTTEKGMTMKCINYGCIITDLIVPGRNGNKDNVVLGFDTLEDYIKHSPFFGAIVGRVAGRIAGGSFTLNGDAYQLPKTQSGNTLHGGVKGFDKVVWDYEMVERGSAAGVEFTYISSDGEEGFPGNLQVKTTYLLDETGSLEISYEARSDQDTIVNLTNHSYFNLSGDLNKKILNHTLQLKSSSFLELGNDLIPTGEIIPVDGTPFDFRDKAAVSQGMHGENPQNKLAGGGYDHPFCLDRHFEEEIVLEDTESGRKLVVETDQPGVVIYTCNQYEGDYSIRGVKPHDHMAICLETQGYPDAIHKPHFPSIILKKDDMYKAVTRYSFR
ncbi:aldose epimerase family protein [Pradoshia sp.]